MMYRVIITDTALAKVEAYLDSLDALTKTPNLAERWWRDALDQVHTLSHFPHRCPIAPEDAYADYTVRAMVVKKCLFLYRVDDDQRVVRVFGFRHGAQLPQPDQSPSDP